jgi:hypothetical protein
LNIIINNVLKARYAVFSLLLVQKGAYVLIELT